MFLDRENSLKLVEAFKNPCSFCNNRSPGRWKSWTNSIPYQDGYGTARVFRKERRSRQNFLHLTTYGFSSFFHLFGLSLDQPIAFFLVLHLKRKGLLSCNGLTAFLLHGAAPSWVPLSGWLRIGILVYFPFAAVGCFCWFCPFVWSVGQRSFRKSKRSGRSILSI